MNNSLLLLAAAALLPACAGDNHVTRQSPVQPSRGFSSVNAAEQVRGSAQRDGRYSANRIYLITRLQTADDPQGEWRANGGTIRQNGTDIEFTELGSGKTISFTGPHQITPTDAGSDRTVTQFTNEEPNRNLDGPR